MASQTHLRSTLIKWSKAWKVSAISAVVGVLIAVGAAAWVQPHADYQRTETGYAIALPQSTTPLSEVPAEQKVVTDYFYYGCPHCRAFAPMLEAWAKQHGADVTLKRIPVTGGRPDLTRQATLFYALETLGEIPRLNESVFQAVARKADFPVSDSDLAEWAVKVNIDPQRLLAAFHAPGMRDRIDAGDQAFHAMALSAVPAIAVRGRWVVTPDTAGSIERMTGATTAALSAVENPHS